MASPGHDAPRRGLEEQLRPLGAVDLRVGVSGPDRLVLAPLRERSKVTPAAHTGCDSIGASCCASVGTPCRDVADATRSHVAVSEQRVERHAGFQQRRRAGRRRAGREAHRPVGEAHPEQGSGGHARSIGSVEGGCSTARAGMRGRSAGREHQQPSRRNAEVTSGRTRSTNWRLSAWREISVFGAGLRPQREPCG